MKYTYHLSESIDVIDNNILTPKRYHDFVDELQILNNNFHYTIFLNGSYVGFLINQTPYNDIDFVVFSEKIMEIDRLTVFFKEFHNLCKKFNIGYDMIYAAEVDENNMNQNASISGFLGNGKTRIMRLYSHKTDERGLTQAKYIKLNNTELFESMLDINKSTKKFKIGRQKNLIFNSPIKISE
jgi:hypothetical protein